MGQKMAYLELRVLQHCLGLSSFTPPATLYALASTATFDATLTGSTVIEPTDLAYARVAITNNSTSWTAVVGSSPSTSNNINQINFPTAAADWGTVLSVYLADALTNGNLLYGTAVPGAGIPIVTLSTFFIPIGALVLRET